jgi:hypothetical protein
MDEPTGRAKQRARAQEVLVVVGALLAVLFSFQHDWIAAGLSVTIAGVPAFRILRDRRKNGGRD